MEAPPFVCRELARVAPNLRLAWAGTFSKDELNAGSYALVELYPRSVYGPDSKPHIFQDSWAVATGWDKYGKTEMKRIDRGPVFNKKGGLKPDWDLLAQVPVYKVNLTELGVPNEAVHTTAFIKTVREWYRPFIKRYEESITQAQRTLEHQVQDISKEAFRRLWRDANKPDATGPTVAWKHARDEIKAFYEKPKPLENYYDARKAFR